MNSELVSTVREIKNVAVSRPQVLVRAGNDLEATEETEVRSRTAVVVNSRPIPSASGAGPSHMAGAALQPVAPVAAGPEGANATAGGSGGSGGSGGGSAGPSSSAGPSQRAALGRSEDGGAGPSATSSPLQRAAPSSRGVPSTVAAASAVTPPASLLVPPPTAGATQPPGPSSSQPAPSNPPAPVNPPAGANPGASTTDPATSTAKGIITPPELEPRAEEPVKVAAAPEPSPPAEVLKSSLGGATLLPNFDGQKQDAKEKQPLEPSPQPRGVTVAPVEDEPEGSEVGADEDLESQTPLDVCPTTWIDQHLDDHHFTLMGLHAQE